MKKICIICVLQFVYLYAFTQSIPLINTTDLNFQIDETSGLEKIQNSYFTHNDDTDVKLFEFDENNGDIIREIIINSGANIDWEDLTADDSYVYIGDIGNNQGNRTNLKLYKCPLNPTTGNINSIVTPQVINFSYADQTNFSPGSGNHNFDAEAIISIGNFIYLFTKNWANSKSHIYEISKSPGTFIVIKLMK